MDTNTFDRIIGRLSADASRRQMLRGVLGTVLAGATVLEAKPTHAAKKRRRRKSLGLVAICHVTDGGKDMRRIRVGRRAQKAHLAHGDTPFVDCCVNEDCDVPACYTAQCVAGACSQTTLPPGTPCTFGAGAVGECTFAGECLPTGTGGG